MNKKLILFFTLCFVSPLMAQDVVKDELPATATPQQVIDFERSYNEEVYTMSGRYNTKEKDELVKVLNYLTYDNKEVDVNNPKALGDFVNTKLKAPRKEPVFDDRPKIVEVDAPKEPQKAEAPVVVPVVEKPKVKAAEPEKKLGLFGRKSKK